MHTHQNSSHPVATIGVDIGKNTFHLVGLDKRGAIALRTKVSRSQLDRRLANVPCCLVGMEAGCGSHHIGPPPMKWSDSKYGYATEEDCNGEEAQA